MDHLVEAYRRCKVDLYYRDEPRLDDLVEYERDLSARLRSLLERITSSDRSQLLTDEFVGDFNLMPAGISNGPRSASGMVWSDPRKLWKKQRGADAPTAKFRVMSRCSIDLHVLSTLWLMGPGDHLDGALSDAAFGSRLRRTRDRRLNRVAPSSFKNYAYPYRSWRDNALSAIERALGDGRSIVALTADASAFFHCLDARFLTDERFLEAARVELDDDERALNSLFAEALQSWSRRLASLATESLGASVEWPVRGLPVGLPASAVVANVALVEFDRLVEEEIKPIHYGRYVDDIILVVEDGGHLQAESQIWKWVGDRFNGLLKIEPDGGEVLSTSRVGTVATNSGDDEDDGPGSSSERDPGASSPQHPGSVRFTPTYLEGSDVVFDNGKNKLFHLEGPGGRFVLESLRRVINANTSAWRALPTISDDPGSIGAKVVNAATDQGEAAATLRDADRISARRSEFAIMLRDFEAYERDLDLVSWSEQRSAFFGVVRDRLFRDPCALFDFSGYLRRVMKLAAACGDWGHLAELVAALQDTFTLLVSEVEVTVELKGYLKSGRQQDTMAFVADGWGRWLFQSVYQGVAAGLPADGDPSLAWPAIAEMAEVAGRPVGESEHETQQLLEFSHHLFIADLAHAPFRNLFLSPHFAAARGIPVRWASLVGIHNVPAGLPENVVEGLADLGLELAAVTKSASAELAERGGQGLPGLAFATRPFSALELYLLLRPLVRPDANPNLSSMLLATRGYILDGGLPESIPDEASTTILVRDHAPAVGEGTKRIGLAMLKTQEDDLIAAALGHPNLHSARYQRMSTLLNSVLQSPQRPNYLLLPELAMPSLWFIRFAHKLQVGGTNLISGIEYQRETTAAGTPVPPPTTVTNQVWAALRADAGFPLHFLHVQDKQRPATAEAPLLHMIDRLTLTQQTPWNLPPTIVHGDLRMALLICSELTNIDYRAHLRGRIDALFVPAWNKDLHSFGALIESAALDIHAYVAQSNCRQYGDSRLRAPTSDPNNRDVVRLQGGDHDYAVIGRINYHTLREHQTLHGAREPFKPTPDGFRIHPDRSRPPRGDQPG